MLVLAQADAQDAGRAHRWQRDRPVAGPAI
jgi:hypothetical protein